MRRVLLPLAGEDEVDKAWREAQDSTGGRCSSVVKPGAKGSCHQPRPPTCPSPAAYVLPPAQFLQLTLGVIPEEVVPT